jgi:uncharacterized protein involved in outer membrane biogenesis
MESQMVIVKRFILWIIIFFLTCVIVFSLYIHYQGKNLLVSALKKTFGSQARLGTIHFYPPFGLRAEDVHLGKDFTARQVSVQLEPFSVLTNHVRLFSVSLLEPEFTFDRSGPSNFRPTPLDTAPARSSPSETATNQVSKAEASGKSFEIIRLTVKNGRFHYQDDREGGDFSFGLRDVGMNVQGLSFPPKSRQVRFQISGRLAEGKTPFDGSFLRGKGWLDIVKKDMNAEITIMDPQGQPALTAMAVSLDNDMSVSGHLVVSDFLKGVNRKQSSDDKAINDLLLHAFSTMGVEIDADFSFKTKMDEFKIRDVGISGKVNAGNFFGSSAEKN